MSNPMGRPGRLSADDKAVVVGRYAAGDRPVDIGAAHGVHATYVIRLAKAAGHALKYGKGNYRPNPQRDSQVAQHEAAIRVFVAEGRTDSFIGGQYGVSRETIKRFRARKGMESAVHVVKRASPQKSKLTNFEWTAEAVERLRLLWAASNNTAEWIGEQFGLSKCSITGKINRLDLPQRYRSPVRSGVTSVKSAPRIRIPAVPKRPKAAALVVVKKPPAPVVAALDPQPIELFDYPADEPGRGQPEICKYVGGDHGKWRWCHAEVEGGTSWCSGHAALFVFRRAA